MSVTSFSFAGLVGPGWLPRPHRAAAKDLLAESRPAVQLVFVMRAAATSGLIAQPTSRHALTLTGWAMLTAAIYLFNGLTDMRSDRANLSTRPLASGRLSPRSAWRCCVALAAAGLALCLHVSVTHLVLGAAMLALGWAYSAGPMLKNSPTGFAVAIAAGAALTYTAGLATRGDTTLEAIICTVTVSAWVGASSGSKDFSDIDGDRLAGRRTWPVTLGPTHAAHRLSLTTALAAITALAASAWFAAPPAPAIVLTIGSVALTVTTLRTSHAAQRIVRRRPYRVFMATQYATNIAIAAVLVA